MSPIKHSDLPSHCSICGADWPENHHGICPSCKAGLPCRADTTDTVAPDPPCAGSRLRAKDGTPPAAPSTGVPACPEPLWVGWRLRIAQCECGEKFKDRTGEVYRRHWRSEHSAAPSPADPRGRHDYDR